MNIDTWQSYLDDIIKEPGNALLDKAIEAGKIPIGYTCSYVPKVLLSADRLLPIRMRAPGITGTDNADIYLSGLTCTYARSILEYAMDNQYGFIKGWVFAAGCDHIRRLYDNFEYLFEPDFNHIIDVPHRIGDTALAWYVEELDTLRKALSSHFDVNMGDQPLSVAISRQNKFHQLLRSIGDLRKRKNPPLTGTEFHRIFIASLVSPQNLIEEHIKKIHDSLVEGKGIEDYRARLMVVGGQMDDPGFIDIIESVGGVVVADRFCTGSIPGLDMIDEKKDPLDAIAINTLYQTSCPRMMEEFETRVKTILQVADEYNVDGIVIENIKFCDTWGIESGLLESTIREAGLPVLRIEREYRITGKGQMLTRIQAFLERMGK